MSEKEKNKMNHDLQNQNLDDYSKTLYEELRVAELRIEELEKQLQRRNRIIGLLAELIQNLIQHEGWKRD